MPDANLRQPPPASSAEPPAQGAATHHHLQNGNAKEIARKRLLARLVPKHRPPRIGPGRPTQQRQPKQPSLRHPPPLRASERLVDPEQREGEEVEEEEGEEDGGEDGEKHHP